MKTLATLVGLLGLLVSTGAMIEGLPTSCVGLSEGAHCLVSGGPATVVARGTCQKGSNGQLTCMVGSQRSSTGNPNVAACANIALGQPCNFATPRIMSPAPQGTCQNVDGVKTCVRS